MKKKKMMRERSAGKMHESKIKLVASTGAEETGTDELEPPTYDR